MVNGTTWEEETQALLTRALTERKRVEDEVVYWTKLTESLEKVLELTKQGRVIKVDSHAVDAESLRKKTIRQSLIELARDKNGLLRAADAVHILMKAGVYQDAMQARGTVYSVLRNDKTRHGEHFIKERPGLYKLISGQEAPLPMKI